jgi:RIO kinase 1
MKHTLELDTFLDDDEFVMSITKHRANLHARDKETKIGKQKRTRLLSEKAELAHKSPDLGDSFTPTFSSSEHERFWILNYLEEFYNNQIISDVLRKVKGGKEANVYCCTANPATGLDLIAAKLYRPRMFRNLRNDARYRQGRALRDEEGKITHNRRKMVAIQQNTRFGQEVRFTSWVEHEYQTLQLLYAAGADVPKPLAHSSTVIMMEYIGEYETPAPTLNQVYLTRREARVIFDRVVENMNILLACHVVHADLSAYNLLYWDGHFKMIDFPQAVDPRHNPDAPALFARDVERICQYFTRYEITPNAAALASELWERYQFTNALDAEFNQDDEEFEELG